MTSAVITWLRFLLVLVLAGAFLGQLLVPVVAREQGEIFPEVEHLVVPYSIAGIGAIACVQAGIVCVWVLLSLIADRRIFTPGALRWVDAMARCGGAAAAICALTAGHLVMVEGLGGPGIVLAGFAALVIGGTFVLLTVAMRGLLAAAVADRAELAEVI
ncbi:DUF2975 domain-containing protein [Demequina silvatica]|uniref:DUF2975 domain-containing protein n=1 Tax=Demequina silvatica TaxID=1638988 RepID=UPI0007832408|nr:DUF2975 domain-containing protein [Demequina silvatica]